MRIVKKSKGKFKVLEHESKVMNSFSSASLNRNCVHFSIEKCSRMQLLRLCNASCYANASWETNTCFSLTLVLHSHQCVCVGGVHKCMALCFTVNSVDVYRLRRCHLRPCRHHFPSASYYDRHIRESRWEFEQE